MLEGTATGAALVALTRLPSGSRGLGSAGFGSDAGFGSETSLGSGAGLVSEAGLGSKAGLGSETGLGSEEEASASTGRGRGSGLAGDNVATVGITTTEPNIGAGCSPFCRNRALAAMAECRRTD